MFGDRKKAQVSQERQSLQVETEELGQAMNALREKLLAANFPYAAGVLRAAEEAVLVVFHRLGDVTVPDQEV